MNCACGTILWRKDFEHFEMSVKVEGKWYCVPCYLKVLAAKTRSKGVEVANQDREVARG